MVVLHLDLGTTMGWTADDGRLLAHGFVSFKPKGIEGGGMRYVKFSRWLRGREVEYGRISEVYFEEVKRHAGTTAAHVYGGFLAVLTAWCELKQIPYQGVPVQTIKIAVTGKGNAGKPAMIAAVQKLGYPDVTDDNEADSIALAHWYRQRHRAVA